MNQIKSSRREILRLKKNDVNHVSNKDMIDFEKLFSDTLLNTIIKYIIDDIKNKYNYIIYPSQLIETHIIYDREQEKHVHRLENNQKWLKQNKPKFSNKSSSQILQRQKEEDDKKRLIREKQIKNANIPMTLKYK